MVFYRNSIEANGFKPYAIGAFSKANQLCLHNCFYWRRDDYIGLGPGAHSWFLNKRFKRKQDLSQYMVSPLPKMPKKICSKKEQLKDFLVSRTRLFEPILFEEIARFVSPKTMMRLQKCLSFLTSLAYVKADDTQFYFTKKGRYLLDELSFTLYDSLCLN